MVRLCACPVNFFTLFNPNHTPRIWSVTSKSQCLYSAPLQVHHSKRSIFFPEELQTATHVFLRVDSARKSLQPRYDGPFAVLDRNNKNFKLKLHNRTSWIAIDRLKPAFLLREDPVADHSYAYAHVESQSQSTSPLHEVSTTEHSYNSIIIEPQIQPILRKPLTWRPKKQVRFFFPRGR